MEWGGIYWSGLVQDGGRLKGCSECGNETSGFVKCWEVLVWLRN
jgi:hypothetical protein